MRPYRSERAFARYRLSKEGSTRTRQPEQNRFLWRNADAQSIKESRGCGLKSYREGTPTAPVVDTLLMPVVTGVASVLGHNPERSFLVLKYILPAVVYSVDSSVHPHPAGRPVSQNRCVWVREMVPVVESVFDATTLGLRGPII